MSKEEAYKLFKNQWIGDLKGEIIMINKTVKQIMEENKGKEIHLIDGMGTWGELPLTENNTQHIPDAVEINDNVVKMYII